MTKLKNNFISEEEYLQICKQTLFTCALRSNDEPYFIEAPQEYNDFLDRINACKSQKECDEFLTDIFFKFNKFSRHRNPLDLLFSQTHNWNVNSYVIIKNFIPNVLRMCPDVKFKRIGCVLQTNNHFYLFTSMFYHLIKKAYKQNYIKDQERIDELLTVYLTIRYRQIHGDKDLNHFENKFLEAHNKLAFENGESACSDYKEVFAIYRDKMHSLKITNKQLEHSIKTLQNILGSQAMTSTKRSTFFWQMYADLECVVENNYQNEPNYTTEYEEKFFIHLQENDKNEFKFIFNKAAFKAYEYLGLTKTISTPHLLYIYILIRIYEKFTDDFISADTLHLRNSHHLFHSSEAIFKMLLPHRKDILNTILKDKRSISEAYNLIFDGLNNSLKFSENQNLNFFIRYIIKEELGILDKNDLVEIYKDFL